MGGVWRTHQMRAVLVGLNAFTIVMLALLWVVTGETDFLIASVLLALLGVVGKALKALSSAIAPRLSSRPVGAEGCRAFYGQPGASTTGMPSGHAMGAAVMAYYAAYFIRKNNSHGEYNNAAVALVYGIAGLISLSRVLYGCHTLAQITVGFAVGILYASQTTRFFRTQ